MLVEVYMTVTQNLGEFVALSEYYIPYPSMLPSLVLCILHRCHLTNTTDHSRCVYVGRFNTSTCSYSARY